MLETLTETELCLFVCILFDVEMCERKYPIIRAENNEMPISDTINQSHSDDAVSRPPDSDADWLELIQICQITSYFIKIDGSCIHSLFVLFA